MRCPFCGSAHSNVVDKRAVKSSGEIRRRRVCLKCDRRFTTYERISEIERFVIKRDGRRQLYERSKLRSGIEKALEKRPAFDQIDAVVAKIEDAIWADGEKEIESDFIGRLVLSELKKLDVVAYLRFASVYRKFDTPTDFTKELESLAK